MDIIILCSDRSGVHRCFILKSDWILRAVPVCDFLPGSHCSAQPDTIPSISCFWDASETCCGASGGIASAVTSGHDQLQGQLSSHNAMQP